MSCRYICIPNLIERNRSVIPVMPGEARPGEGRGAGIQDFLAHDYESPDAGILSAFRRQTSCAGTPERLRAVRMELRRCGSGILIRFVSSMAQAKIARNLS